MYTPNNDYVFTAAFAGCLSGITASGRNPTSTTPADYDNTVTTAGAFAQEFDTLWALAPAATLEIQTIEEACEGAWSGRAPLDDPAGSVPATWQPLCQGIITIVQAGLAYYAAQNIPNPPAGGGGGGGGFTYPNRVDCSVNSARIDDANGDTPIIRTLTSGNAAGGYNGGGVGSKAILGIDVANLLPLGALTSLQWTAKNLMPYNPQPWPIAGYTNLIVDINGNGTVYKIFIIDPQSLPALLQCSITPNGDGSNTINFDPSTNLVLVVGLIPPVVPTVNLGPSFLQQGFSIASILASYPLARFARANSGDGGLPKLQVIPPWLIVTGDSGNNKIVAMRLLSAFFNGVQV